MTETEQEIARERGPDRARGANLVRAAEMVREGYARARIVSETGITAAQVAELMVRVGRARR